MVPCRYRPGTCSKVTSSNLLNPFNSTRFLGSICAKLTTCSCASGLQRIGRACRQWPGRPKRHKLCAAAPAGCCSPVSGVMGSEVSLVQVGSASEPHHFLHWLRSAWGAFLQVCGQSLSLGAAHTDTGMWHHPGNVMRPPTFFTPKRQAGRLPLHCFCRLGRQPFVDGLVRVIVAHIKYANEHQVRHSVRWPRMRGQSHRALSQVSGLSHDIFRQDLAKP